VFPFLFSHRAATSRTELLTKGRGGPEVILLRGKVAAEVLLVMASNLSGTNGGIFLALTISLIKSACLPVTTSGQMTTVPEEIYFSLRRPSINGGH
jgi:hypothetical protein